ncbi:MAG: hypothetical protein IKY10_01075, partial [Clostridia bacterium]|nr:hypothetical protein [Clostridia bacterium]
VSINNELLAGGFIGEYVIGNETGSIQQSYSNTTCGDVNYGAFIGKISLTNDFNKEEANVLRYLIGNMAVVYGKSSQATVVDSDVVKNYDKTFFKNMTYKDRDAFYEKDAAMYLIRGYKSAGDLIDADSYIYYALDAENLIYWDTTYVWNVTDNALPKLKMGNIYPTGPSGEYFRRDLLQKQLNSKNAFLELFNSDIEGQNIKFLCDLDLTDSWNPIAVSNTTIDGNNKTVKINLASANAGNLGLFSVVDNCTIKNLKIVVTGVSANSTNAGALAGIIKSNGVSTSTIENVQVTYQSFDTPVITNFGGIAGTIENTVISGCSVAIKMNKNASVSNAGGIVAVNNGTIKNTIISGDVSGTAAVGGFVAKNNSTITSVSGGATVNFNKNSSDAAIGGVVGLNNGVVNASNVTTEIRISNVGANSYIGGIVGSNHGTIENVNVEGQSISTPDVSSTIYIGGVAGSNSGTIKNVNNKISSVGTYHIGTNQFVGGVVAVNSGSISKVLTQSDLYGNTVAGVVVSMNKAGATIEEVAVGKYNSNGKQLGENTIAGDKYLAGIVVDFKAGTIKNIQCSSNISGQANSTRSSLVALIFPYGATLKNATINSSLTGYGTRYRETWTDFASYTNKAEFGLSNGETGDERFNIYKYDTYHGIMQSVVINSAKSGVSGAKAAMGAAFAWGKDYQDTADSSFVKTVNGFNDVSQFQGSFTFVCSISTVLGIKHEATKTLTFEIGTHWESNNGISLIFLRNM